MHFDKTIFVISFMKIAYDRIRITGVHVIQDCMYYSPVFQLSIHRKYFHSIHFYAQF
jgi:hypothetical protein